jgi:hypothetical protein
VQWNASNVNDLTSGSANNSNNLDIVSSCLENLEKHVEVLNEQKSVTFDAFEKTMTEGDALLSYLHELSNNTNHSHNNNNNKQSEQEQKNSATPNSTTKSTSYTHLENMLESVRGRYGDIDKLLVNCKTKLDHQVHVKQFEKDALEASQALEQWSEELKYLEDELSGETSSSAESLLHSQIQTANHMQSLVFELLQRGTDLIQQCANNSNGGGCGNDQQHSLTLNDLFCVDATTTPTTTILDSSTTSSLTSTSTASQHTLNWLKQQNSIANANVANNNSKYKNYLFLYRFIISIVSLSI